MAPIFLSRTVFRYLMPFPVFLLVDSQSPFQLHQGGEWCNERKWENTCVISVPVLSQISFLLRYRSF